MCRLKVRILPDQPKGKYDMNDENDKLDIVRTVIHNGIMIHVGGKWPRGSYQPTKRFNGVAPSGGNGGNGGNVMGKAIK
jgi:hypothetical protein